VQFENVSFAYEPASFVLKNVTFALEPGESVALVGPSGIGKSTLVSLVLRLYDPAEGRVLIDGEDVRRYKVASLRSQISVVMQDSILFSGTIAENIAYTAPDATHAEIAQAAKLAGAASFIHALPDGLETQVGERGETLSYGQRQRLAIARAAIRESPILILDEPLAGLDEENEQLVADALARLAAGRTTFLVTHDLLRASRADRIVYLQDGRLVEQGTHRELMAAGGSYARLYRLQLAEPLPDTDNRLSPVT
jgi:ATP-binding cassette subfamily B protein